MPSEMSARHSAVLARLTELGLALAERVQAQAMAAEGPEDLDRMSQAFHRVSRSVRMSLALEAKLARAERDEQRARDAAPAQRPPIDREFVNVIVKPTWVDEYDETATAAPRWTEREGEDWAPGSEAPGLQTPGIETAGEPARAGRAPSRDTAAEAEAVAARIAFVKSELACEFGPAYAEARAAQMVGEEMRRDEDRARAARADTS